MEGAASQVLPSVHHLRFLIFDWSLPNVIMGVIVIVVFFAAAWARLPKWIERGTRPRRRKGEEEMSMTEKLQGFVKDKLTLDDILPTKLPVYVNSVAYLFGVFTLCSLVMIVVTGLIMAVFGPNLVSRERNRASSSIRSTSGPSSSSSPSWCSTWRRSTSSALSVTGGGRPG